MWSSLISRLLGPANARSVQQDRSFWTPLIGEQAFSRKLTIVDDPLIVRGLASRRYDSEGISARALPIVEDGVISNIYVDTYYGRKGDMTPTTGSPSNRIVRPGDLGLSGLTVSTGAGASAALASIDTAITSVSASILMSALASNRKCQKLHH